MAAIEGRGLRGEGGTDVDKIVWKGEEIEGADEGEGEGEGEAE